METFLFLFLIVAVNYKQRIFEVPYAWLLARGIRWNRWISNLVAYYVCGSHIHISVSVHFGLGIVTLCVSVYDFEGCVCTHCVRDWGLLLMCIWDSKTAIAYALNVPNWVAFAYTKEIWVLPSLAFWVFLWVGEYIRDHDTL